MPSRPRVSRAPKLGGPYPIFPADPSAFRPSAKCGHTIPAWSQGVCMVCHRTGAQLEARLAYERLITATPEVDTEAKIKARAKLQALHRANRKNRRVA